MRRSSGAGSQGERVQEWACVALTEVALPGMRRWLLVRRPLEQSRRLRLLSGLWAGRHTGSGTGARRRCAVVD
ncbi:MAG: hypothetical protein H0X37_22205 [Herpetosiphonaceae bacterium]|nr:hypothetical protein [Herpetosiphonaceae bacterium]